jgi:uncharacterized protein YecA (UPF0149 family)
MNVNEDSDSIIEVMEMVKKYIHAKKLEENVDLSDKHMVRTWCMIQSKECSLKKNTWQYDDLLKSPTKNDMTTYILKNRQMLERTETERAKRSRKNNIAYIPIIEYLIKIIMSLHRYMKP